MISLYIINLPGRLLHLESATVTWDKERSMEATMGGGKACSARLHLNEPEKGTQPTGAERDQNLQVLKRDGKDAPPPAR